MSKSADDNIRL